MVPLTCFAAWMLMPGDAAPKPHAELIYFESTIRNRTPYIVNNTDRLRELPFDGLMVNIPASWSVMTDDRWTYDDSFGFWIEPLIPVFSDPTLGLKTNYIMAYTDREADFLQPWDTTIANFRDLARLARDAGFVGIAFDNEEYAAPLWDWPSTVDQPLLGPAQYEAAARDKGSQIGSVIADEFPDIRVIILHGPYIADDNVPNSIRLDQFGVGAFELYGHFYAGLLEGLGPRATIIDGGEVYALRDPQQFRDHALWRRWGLSSDAHDAEFLTPDDRRRHRQQSRVSFGVYTNNFPTGYQMDPPTLGSALAAALRESDGVTWLYSEEGRSAWLADEFDDGWLPAVRDAVNQARSTPARRRFGIDDLHRFYAAPFDADQNGVTDDQDREAIEYEIRAAEQSRAP